jgi:hypothetical protein
VKFILLGMARGGEGRVTVFGLWYKTGHRRYVMEIRRMTTDTQNMPLRVVWYVRVHDKTKRGAFQKQSKCILSGCLAFSWFHIGSESSNVLKISLLLVPLMIIAMGCLSLLFVFIVLIR